MNVAQSLPLILLCEPFGLAYGITVPIHVSERHSGIDFIANVLEKENIANVYIVKGNQSIFDALKKLPSNFTPSLIGFSLLVSTLPADAERMAELKTLFPRAIFVAGGPDIKQIPEKVIFDCLPIDYAVIGDGAMGIKYILENINKTERWIIPDTISTLNISDAFEKNPELSFSRKDFMGNRPLRVLFSSTCDSPCSFCISPKSNNINDTKKLADYVIKNANNVNYLHFNDNCIMSHKSSFLSFLNMLEVNGLRAIPKYGKCRAGLLDMLTADMLKYYGFCSLGIGIESFDNRILQDIKKGFSVSQIKNGLDCLLSAGIVPKIFLILFTRKEDKKSLYKTLNSVLRLLKQGAVLGGVMPWLAASWKIAARRGHNDIEWVKMDFSGLRASFNYPWREKCRDFELREIQEKALNNRDIYYLKKLPAEFQTQIHFQDLCLLASLSNSLGNKFLETGFCEQIQRDIEFFASEYKLTNIDSSTNDYWLLPPILLRSTKSGYKFGERSNKMNIYARNKLNSDDNIKSLTIHLVSKPSDNKKIYTDGHLTVKVHATTQLQNYLSLSKRLKYSSNFIRFSSNYDEFLIPTNTPLAKIIIFLFNPEEFSKCFIDIFDDWKLSLVNKEIGITIFYKNNSILLIDIEKWTGDSAGRFLNKILLHKNQQIIQEVIILGACGCAKGAIGISNQVFPDRALNRKMNEILFFNVLSDFVINQPSASIISTSCIAEEDESLVENLSKLPDEIIIVDLETEGILNVLAQFPLVKFGAVYEVTDSLENDGISFSHNNPRCSLSTSVLILELIHQRACLENSYESSFSEL